MRDNRDSFGFGITNTKLNNPLKVSGHISMSIRSMRRKLIGGAENFPTNLTRVVTRGLMYIFNVSSKMF